MSWVSSKLSRKKLAFIGIAIIFTINCCLYGLIYKINVSSWDSWILVNPSSPNVSPRQNAGHFSMPVPVDDVALKRPNIGEKEPEKNPELSENSTDDELTIFSWNGIKGRKCYRYCNATQVTCSKGVRCVFTADRSLINEADLIIFDGIVVGQESPPAWSRGRSGKNQIRLGCFYEPPQPSPGFLDDAMLASFQINWTLSYRYDSDVVVPIFSFEPLSFTKNDSQGQTGYDDDQLHRHKMEIPRSKLDEYENRYLVGKSKLIAWIVSHCHTYSQRENIVWSIQQFVPVDIYGQCGVFECPSNEDPFLSIQKKSKNHMDNCYNSIGRTYKFYLAFENSLCEDYVTEKLSFSLMSNMVPIVYGEADYVKTAPPGSFINILDFDSIKELSEYLQFLDKNDEEYLKYFLWKEKYRIAERQLDCKVCEALWRVSKRDEQSGKLVVDPSYSKMYGNLTQWWYGSKEDNNLGIGQSVKSACRAPTKFIDTSVVVKSQYGRDAEENQGMKKLSSTSSSTPTRKLNVTKTYFDKEKKLFYVQAKFNKMFLV